MFYEAHTAKKGNLPYSFADYLKKPRPSHRIHWHENLELLCFYTGNGVVRLDGEDVPVTAGETVIVSSNMLHTVYIGENCRYYCLILDVAEFRSWGIPLERFTFTKKIGDPELFRRISALKPLFHTVLNGGTELDRIRLQIAVFDVISPLLAFGEFDALPCTDRRHFELCRRVMEYVDRQFKETVTVDDISRALGFSKYHLCRVFKACSGRTVIEYLNYRRCQRARELIAAGSAVGAAARECGFSNLSYFSKTFRRYVGCAPGECRREAREEKWEQK